MLRSKKRWKVERQGHSLQEQFVTELKISPLVASLLLNRGITSVEEAQRFLYIEKVDFHDPFMMKGMRQATERIEKAINDHEKILIFGDYDADGVSSTAVLVLALQQLNAKFDYYIPNRFTEGYGPNEAAFKKAKEDGYTLIITVDTGASAVHEANVAKELGIDLIITDHHEPPPLLPDALAIVNPKQEDCLYPFKGLAGVGVAFKLAHALLGQAPNHLLDVAVIGTIADLVPLQDENRLIAKLGIKALANTERPGLIALKQITSMNDKELTADHIGFGIAPRINAAGRLSSAKPAVELLISDDYNKAFQIATEIDELNKVRQGIVNEMTEEAIAIVEENFASLEDNKVLIVAKEGWNAGVIGIVASRLVERYYRPTIVMSIDPEKKLAKGSARSIEGFDMFKNLSECRDILPHFGGHPMAAGLTMKVEDVGQLRERLHFLASETLTDYDYIPMTNVDIEINLSDVSLKVIEEMSLLAPFGVSNPTPKVMIDKVNVSQIKRIGSEENHLKMLIEQNGKQLDCVGFHYGYLFEEISMAAKLSLVGTLSINEWNGNSKSQLMLEDIAINEWQLFDCRGNKGLQKFDHLPQDKVVCIYFKEETVKKFNTLKEFEFLHVRSEENISSSAINGKYVFFLDLPYDKNQIEKLFTSSNNPERIYTIFHHNENHFFTTIPSRDHFKWFYAFLTKKQTFDLKKHGEALAKHKGWSKDTIDFMVKVFFELEFVTITNGLISLSANIEKKDLTYSKTYKQKQLQASLENDLYYSSYNELKDWFDQIFSNNEVNNNLAPII